MKMYFEMTPEEQVAELEARMERIGYRNLWLECENECLKDLIRDMRKESEMLRELLIEEFQKNAEKS